MGATLPDGTSDNLPATKKRRRGGDKKDKEKAKDDDVTEGTLGDGQPKTKKKKMKKTEGGDYTETTTQN